MSHIKLECLTLELVNIAAPEHSRLRYKDDVICSDDKRLGGLDVEFEAKEWRCKRCVLLDILQSQEWRDWGECKPELVLEVHNVGNVR